MVAAVLDDFEAAVGDAAVVFLGGGYGDYVVLRAPDDHCGQALQAVHLVDQARVVHVGTPRDAAGGLHAQLPALQDVLLGLGGTDGAVLGRAVGVQQRIGDVHGRRDLEDVVDLAAGRADAAGAHEYQVSELLRAHGRQLGGDPATEGESHEVGALQAELVQRAQVPDGEVVDAHGPVEDVGAADAGERRDVQGVVLREGLVVAQPAGVPQLVGQDDQRGAGTARDHLHVGAGHVGDAGSPGLRCSSHNVKNPS